MGSNCSGKIKKSHLKNKVLPICVIKTEIIIKKAFQLYYYCGPF